MNKWEQFEYILKCTLPSYKRFTNLSLECTRPHHHYEYYNYVWRLQITYGCGLYQELVSLSKFCGIEWEHQFYTESDGGYMIIEMSENYREPISPVFW
jgi:hypothetical protein